MTTAGTPHWAGRAPTVRSRAVLVVPHPDDEVLGSGLLLRWLGCRGVPTTLVAVTDGEGSHPLSRQITPGALRVRRADERARALAALGLPGLPVVRLGVPDGAVAAHHDGLRDELRRLVDEDTTLVAPWRADTHPDHETCGHAAAEVAAERGCGLWEVAIWAKVRRPVVAAEGAHRLLADARSDAAKRSAARRYRSQIAPLGPRPEDGPVVHPHELDALLRGPELVRCG